MGEFIVAASLFSAYVYIPPYPGVCMCYNYWCVAMWLQNFALLKLFGSIIKMGIFECVCVFCAFFDFHILEKETCNMIQKFCPQFLIVPFCSLLLFWFSFILNIFLAFFFFIFFTILPPPPPPPPPHTHTHTPRLSVWVRCTTVINPETWHGQWSSRLRWSPCDLISSRPLSFPACVLPLKEPAFVSCATVQTRYRTAY